MRNGAIQLTRRITATQCRHPSKSRLQQQQLFEIAGGRWSSSTTASKKRTWSTPLAKTIADAIETTGPISIAAYMRQCLTSPQGGYYTTTTCEQSDQFGKSGDFITSPEISQVFGELVAVWFVAEWMAQGRKSGGVQLIEVGPGRGTLMDDLLRTISNFGGFRGSVEKVWLVEAGEGLRKKQWSVLCGGGGGGGGGGHGGQGRDMVKTETGWRSVSKYGGIPVEWVEDVSLLPKDEAKEKMPFIIAHEFFDALPIHAFESVAPSPAHQQQQQQQQNGQTSSRLLDSAGNPLPTSRPPSASTAATPQWRELLVTPTPKRSSPSYLSTQKESDSTPDFHLTLSKSSSPTSLLLPESSPRYKALKSRPGSSIEISPDSSRHIADFARRIGGPNRRPSSVRSPIAAPTSSPGPPSGAALIIDYGPAATIPLNSLRGIRNHTIVSPFIEPGLVDLSADVDFTALAEKACEASAGVEVWGPVEQGDFLTALGGEERVGRLVDGVNKGVKIGEEGERERRHREEKRRLLLSGWKRLVEKGGMGRIYKVLALLPERGGRRAPVGFGGRVVDARGS